LLGDKNTRLAKPNDNYYLLLHVRTPIVIVECGFLTNSRESKLLNDEDYQDRVAWTIHMGIMSYLNNN
jgi:N-acetylmuramoyl-L-alanine amidase